MATREQTHDTRGMSRTQARPPQLRERDRGGGTAAGGLDADHMQQQQRGHNAPRVASRLRSAAVRNGGRGAAGGAAVWQRGDAGSDETGVC